MSNNKEEQALNISAAAKAAQLFVDENFVGGLVVVSGGFWWATPTRSGAHKLKLFHNKKIVNRENYSRITSGLYMNGQ